MTKSQKIKLARIIASALLFAASFFIPLSGVPLLIWYIVTYLIAGYDIVLRAARNIAHGQVFDENFLMVIATFGAFAIGRYEEAVEVILFYQVGELFQSYAVGKSRRSISALMDIKPEFANVMRDSELVEVDPEDVEVGETIVVKPGERVPLDGVVIEGSSALDTAALTGESAPRDVSAGSEVVSGCINLSGLLKIKTTKQYEDSTVARILDLVENSSGQKAKTENFITKFARYYTPAVVVGAVLLAIIPPLLFNGEWAEWIRRALTFLVVSCPCALVISVPLSFFGGIGGASRSGILIKGGNYLEAIAKAETVVFDKTGTLTKGSFEVTAVHPQEVNESALLEYAAYAESFSDHPIARSIVAAYGKDIDRSRVADAGEISGHGVTAVVDGKKIAAGNAAMMEKVGAKSHECHLGGTVVHVAVDGEYAGHIVISDTVKPDSADAISGLREAGVKRTVMLTGDSEAVAEGVANSLGLDEYRAGMLPQDKVGEVERLLSEKQGGTLVFVGDGINDAPVLTRADVGVAMGAFGSDAAIEAADIVLMDDKPSKLVTAVKIAKRTLSIVRQNVAFALGVKALVLILTAVGLASMQAAVFADVGVAVLAILNAMRALNTKKM